jgi:hypothetical protein
MHRSHPIKSDVSTKWRKDITRQIETRVALLTEVEQRRPLVTKTDELELQRIALATKLQATVPTGANYLKRWDGCALRSIVKRYRSEMEFGDPESKSRPSEPWSLRHPWTSTI